MHQSAYFTECNHSTDRSAKFLQSLIVISDLSGTCVNSRKLVAACSTKFRFKGSLTQLLGNQSSSVKVFFLDKGKSKALYFCSDRVTKY